MALIVIAFALLFPSCGDKISEQVEVIVVGNVQQEKVEQVKIALDKLPQRHLLLADCSCALKSVTIVEGSTLRDLPDDATVFENYPGSRTVQVVGLADLKTGDIYLAADADDGTLYHEVGHIVFDGPARLNVSNANASVPLTRQFVYGDTSLGWYSRKNLLEFKAEAYEHYYTGSDISPEIDRIMQRLFRRQDAQLNH
ncbi:MAG: hypothetical protein ACXABY_15285 [Candidatus Thorarchaeota archaeon]